MRLGAGETNELVEPTTDRLLKGEAGVSPMIACSRGFFGVDIFYSILINERKANFLLTLLNIFFR